MTLQDQLDSDLKIAMIDRDEARKNAIRSAKTAILNAQVEKRGTQGPDAVLSEEEILAVISKQAKQRRDSIAEYSKAGRTDLVEQEEAELAVLELYLPRQLSHEEIKEVLQAIIAETGATGPQQIGQVMQPAMQRLQGQADGRVVNQIARELLSEPS